MTRTTFRYAAAGLALGLVTLGVAPATAADPVARGTGTAVELSVLGNPAGSGTYAAENDGTRQTTSGNRSPAVAVLGGQSVIGAGTLHQDATTKRDGTAVDAAACAGLAGQGATLVAVGDSTCLAPGRTLDLDAGTLDLSKLTVLGGSTLLDGVPEPLKTTLSDPATLAQLTTALSGGLQSALTALGDPGLRLELDAVQASCTAAPGDARGGADLANARLVADVPGQGAVTIADLPVTPGVNAKPVTKLSALSDALLAAIKTDLQGSFGGALGALVPQASQVTVVGNALDQLSTQLAPVTSQVVDLTLNEQRRPDDSSIEVTALSLQVLPAATPALGFPALGLDIGRVTCAAGRYAAPPVVSPPAGNVPTAIDAGSGGADHQGVLTVLGVLALLAGAGVGLRRLVGHRG